MSKTKYDEIMERDNRDKLLEKAAEFYTKLRLELATKSDNERVGSGMGGNASEFFFLLSHKVEIAISPELAFFSRLDENEICFHVPAKPDMKQARKELTKFFNSYPDKLEVTQEQLLDTSFLKDFRLKSLELKLFIRAIEEAKTLSGWLDQKFELKCAINKAFAKEYKSIEISFLKEIDFPLSYFESIKDKENKKVDYISSSIGKMLNEHPVWGERKKAVIKRQEEMLNQLLSQEDLERISFIGTFPSYTTLFAFRGCVGIDRIIHLNLDELPECNFLGRINKIIQDKNVESDED